MKKVERICNEAIINGTLVLILCVIVVLWIIVKIKEGGIALKAAV